MTTEPTNTHNPLIPNHVDKPGDGVAQSSTVDPVLRPPSEEAAVSANDERNPAVNMIRQKLAAIYSDEPDAQAEAAEVRAATAARTKHQQYMYDLSISGKTLAEIQTAWHQYYAGLPDEQKREVWQEFYTNSAKARSQAAQEPAPAPAQAAIQPASPTQQPEASISITQSLPTAVTAPSTPSQPIARPNIYPTPTAPAQRQSNPLYLAAPVQRSETATTQAAAHTPAGPRDQIEAYMTADDRPVASVRDQLRDKIGSRSRLKVKHHLQSLLFGIGFGALVLVIVLFSFFNEVVIAPFIQPSRIVSATPIIVGTDSVAATNKDEVIIPKINLEIPLDFSATSINESDIESGLENGVVHYPTTALPGQQGNASFFGHSSNNIFNPGKYKFAFVLLHELVPGDTFIITYKGVAYTYQVYDKKIVDPSDVSVLNPVDGKPSTAVLITCDPPGTSLHRLVVWGQQVSPNPSSNIAAAPTPTTSGADQTLPGNGPTLWRRLINAITGH